MLRVQEWREKVETNVKGESERESSVEWDENNKVTRYVKQHFELN